MQRRPFAPPGPVDGHAWLSSDKSSRTYPPTGPVRRQIARCDPPSWLPLPARARSSSGPLPRRLPGESVTPQRGPRSAPPDPKSVRAQHQPLLRVCVGRRGVTASVAAAQGGGPAFAGAGASVRPRRIWVEEWRGQRLRGAFEGCSHFHLDPFTTAKTLLQLFPRMVTPAV